MKTWLNAAILLFLLLSFFAVGIPGEVRAQGPSHRAKISSLLSVQVDAKLRLIEAGLGENGQVGIHRAILARTGKAGPPDRQEVFLHSAEPFSQGQIAELETMGVAVYPDSWIPPVGVHRTGFVIADMPVDRLNQLAMKAYISAMDTAERLAEPYNDLAAQKMNVADVWTTLEYDGTGVNIAVLDSGLDLTHPDIPTPVAKKDYSNYPLLDDDISSPASGHGTHVTGSAVGRGTRSGGVYKGMAPGANLIFLKVGNDTTGSSASGVITQAIKDAVDIYHADIITLSYGSWDDFHDGTDQKAQAVDYAVSQGATVFIAAGNEGNDGQHHSLTVPANGTSSNIQVNVTGAGTSDTELWFNLVWYDGTGVHNDLELLYYNSNNALLTSRNFSQSESIRGTEGEESYYGNAGDPFTAPLGNSTYYLRVRNNSQNAQSVHVYYALGGSKVKFANPDPAYTVSSPADADGAIAVGSYTTRTVWYDYANSGWQLGSETVDQISTFSSRGPRLDAGSLKPDIVTPGTMIISARSNDEYPWPAPAGAGSRYIDNDGPNTSNPSRNNGAGPADYFAIQGTSMASPLAAGVAALLLEANRDLQPAEIRQILQSTAVDKGASGADSTYGWGLVNAYQAVSSIMTPEISVLGNGTAIADDDTSPSPTDHTDFGAVAVTGGTLTRTFTIENVGTATLNLNGSPKAAVSGVHAADFTVTAHADSPVSPGASTTFQVRFDPRAAGVRSATINIANNDADENPYSFAIQGTGTASSIAITSPTSSASWTIGTSQSINWTSDGVDGDVKVEISRDGGDWTTINASTPNDGTHSWTVTGPPTSRASIRIAAVADPAVNVNSDNFMIAAAQLTVTGITAENRVYTGNAIASLNVSGATFVGVAPGDTVTLNAAGASGNFTSKHVGNDKTVTIGGLTIGGADAGNYTLVQPTATANITKLAITVAAVADTKTYNGTTASAGTPSIMPAMVGGDTSTFIQTFDNPNAGTAKTLTPSGTVTDGNGGNNYAVTFVPSTYGIIQKASQTITFAATEDQEYGDDLQLTATASSGLSVTYAVTSGSATVQGSTVHFAGVGQVTITASQAGNNNYIAATPVSRTFSVVKGSVTIMVAGLTGDNVTLGYNGSPRPVNVTTIPSGVAVTISYDGYSGPPTALGEYAVIVETDDENYNAETRTFTLLIVKGTPIITWANPSPIVYGVALTETQLNATANIPGAFVYDPVPGTVLNAGSGQSLGVTFSPTDSDNFTSINATASINVLKAAATVTLSDLAQTYNGTPKSITVTTEPAGLNVSVTYSGQATAPSAAGSYPVVATVTENNYQGSASGTMVISAAPVGSLGGLGGGGGGGGGGAATGPGITPLSIYTNADGFFNMAATAKSEDGKAQLALAKGVLANTGDGSPLKSVKMVPAQTSPDPPAGWKFVSLAYDMTPDGATFSPAISLTVFYDPAGLPQNTDTSSLTIAVYNTAQTRWDLLESVRNSADSSVTAQIGHFTTYAVLGKPAAPPPPPPPPAPAKLTVSDVAVSQPAVKPGEVVTVSAKVSNTGGTSGAYDIMLKINGTLETVKSVSVAAGTSATVTFSLNRSAAGTYSVDVNGITTSFAVEEPAPLSTSSPLQEQQADSPQSVPMPPAGQGTNTGVIIGIIGALVVVVGMAAGIALARRRTRGE